MWIDDKSNGKNFRQREHFIRFLSTSSSSCKQRTSIKVLSEARKLLTEEARFSAGPF